MPATKPKIPEKLSERAILVRLVRKAWSGAKTDQKVSDEVAGHYNADTEAGRYIKRLIRSHALADWQQASAELTKAHKALTLPWSDKGDRILLSEGFLTYEERTIPLIDTCNQAADDFATNIYAKELAEAPARLGKMFKKEDYPDPKHIRDMFSVKTRLMAMPNVEDFRFKAGGDKVKQAVEENTQELVKQAMDDIWKRVHDAVKELNERLHQPDKQVRDALIKNVQDLADVLPLLNLTGDNKLSELTDKLRQEIGQVDPKTIRKDKDARAGLANTTQALHDDIAWYIDQ